VRAGLPWPERDARIERLAEMAGRCLAAGLEVYVASDRDELHARMPQGAGAHISRERSARDHGTSLGRTVAVAYWTDTRPEDLQRLQGGEYAWVCLEQLPDEETARFVLRVAQAAEALGL
jgi:hypothetical protein